ncbi:AcylCoA-binding domain containing protein [Acanthamoeba castellanii str. Neff]|uniref:AcylCoA-binding domain containing protein n=1 Tax=Acanthamoeba castellanii (strain ATCC 30010 / Neff) TaxID=1257118 RepID=L8GRT2_ACACF|nr:AcylCoA-binding domain containing protein [Acanthamoeba castellanii str. Neff]ELR15894.1 AcylCoA-binding domain containing protein [Acanthamoeba castellanii str. Neff]
MEGKARFDAAVQFLAENKNKLSFDQAQQLSLYGLFKQANQGPTAWNDLGKMTQQEAMQKYGETVDKFVPGWDKSTKAEEMKGNGDGEAEPQPAKKTGNKSGMVVFSQPVAPNSEDEEEGEQDIWYFASTGDLAQVGSLLAEGQFTLDQPDEDGRTPLMWAADKGRVAVAADLLKRGAAVNARDGDGQTVLHYAALSENEEMLQLLLEHGADKTIPDNDGTLPSELADNERLRKLLE